MVNLFQRRKSFRGPPPPLVPSYSNPGGTGNRQSIITITQFSSNMFVSPNILIDGSTTGIGSYLNGAPDGGWTQFDFGSAKLITEIKFYQSAATEHGVWKVQGSSNGSDFTDIGSTFTLGGSTLQTITEVSVNETSYRYYRLTKVSGTTSAGPWTYEFEFKIA